MLLVATTSERWFEAQRSAAQARQGAASFVQSDADYRYDSVPTFI